MILFFDTETTGLVEPRLVQLGMILTDDKCEIISQVCILVKPAKRIEEGATKAHGKTDEYCEKYGLGIDSALALFSSTLTKCHTIVAHNIKYDKKVMQNEGLTLEGRIHFCTMLASTPILKLPSTKSWTKDYKWPKLEEAYKFFFNKSFEGAHDALNDVKATLEIYKKLKSLEVINSGKNIMVESNGLAQAIA